MLWGNFLRRSISRALALHVEEDGGIFKILSLKHIPSALLTCTDSKNVYDSIDEVFFTQLHSCVLVLWRWGDIRADSCSLGAHRAGYPPTGHRYRERCLPQTLCNPSLGFNSHLPNLQLRQTSVLPKMAFLILPSP